MNEVQCHTTFNDTIHGDEGTEGKKEGRRRIEFGSVGYYMPIRYPGTHMGKEGDMPWSHRKKYPHLAYIGTDHLKMTE